MAQKHLKFRKLALDLCSKLDSQVPSEMSKWTYKKICVFNYTETHCLDNVESKNKFSILNIVYFSYLRSTNCIFWEVFWGIIGDILVCTWLRWIRLQINVNLSHSITHFCLHVVLFVSWSKLILFSKINKLWKTFLK